MLKYQVLVFDGCTTSSDARKARLLHEAFIATFHGDAPQRFCAALRDGYSRAYRPSVHYGRIIPIIQSSCTGKSRLLYEIGCEHIPTFSICLRRYDNDVMDPGQGWPYGDRPVVNYFQPNPSLSSETMAAAFLGQLYKALAAETARVTGVDCFDTLKPKMDYIPRETFFKRVCSAASDVLRQGQLPKMPASISVWYRQLYKFYVEEHAEELARSLGRRSQYEGADFLLVIDECAYLDKEGAQSMKNKNKEVLSFLGGIRRIFKAADDDEGASSTFWLILLDTHGQTHTVYPVNKVRPSAARLMEHTYVPLSPWIDLGFDVCRPLQLPSTPAEALSLDWLKRFGRPYWGQLNAESVLEEAAKNLFCGRIDPADSNHVIAAISRRIYLPLSHDSTNTEIQFAAVARHMRLMENTGPEDGVVTTTAVSEPVLSIAASQIILADRGIYTRLIRRFVDMELVNERIVDRGWRGETLAALILTIARDRAICSPPYNGHIVRKPTANPRISVVTVTEYIVALFGGASVSQSFRVFGDTAWVNFTHIDILPRILVGEISASMLLHAWCRSVAFQCAANQPIYDMLIPVYRGALDQPFDLTKFSYVVVQVKAKTTAAAKAPLESLTGPPIRIGSSIVKPEYVALLLDLGTCSEFQETGTLCRNGREAAVAPSESTSAGLLGTYLASEPIRWFFHARGLTSDTYPGLHQFGAEKLPQVLSPRQVLGAGDNTTQIGREILMNAAARWSSTLANTLVP
ncbi:hypothetical protein B0H11DRAFT_33563 [Mycena galericulata]|nr:hypothetical protein B0H11DRAFT_33563 [Mycena galericulata]